MMNDHDRPAPAAHETLARIDARYRPDADWYRLRSEGIEVGITQGNLVTLGNYVLTTTQARMLALVLEDAARLGMEARVRGMRAEGQHA